MYFLLEQCLFEYDWVVSLVFFLCLLFTKLSKERDFWKDAENKLKEKSICILYYSNNHLVPTLSITSNSLNLLFFIFKVAGLIGSPFSWEFHVVGSESGPRVKEVSKWAAARPQPAHFHFFFSILVSIFNIF